MITRLKQAIHKFFFCLHSSCESRSFFKLIKNSKEFKWRLNSKRASVIIEEKAARYNFRLNGKIAQIFLRTYSGDIAIFYEIFWTKVYELPGGYFKNAKTIIDLGANIGMASLYFSHMSTEARIYAVEPESSNYSLLLKNLHSGIIHKDIIPIQAAMDSEDGYATIQANDLKYNSSIVRTSASNSTIRIMSMNTLLKEFAIEKIDILKIDIEGIEKRLFEGETSWLKIVHYILIEFHSEAIKEFCMDVLVSKNYTIRAMKTGSRHSNIFLAEQNLQN